MVWVFISPITAIIDLIANLPQAYTTAIPTLELIRSTWRTVCEEIQHRSDK